jgi:hypothetical protein
MEDIDRIGENFMEKGGGPFRVGGTREIAWRDDMVPVMGRMVNQPAPAGRLSAGSWERRELLDAITARMRLPGARGEAELAVCLRLLEHLSGAPTLVTDHPLTRFRRSGRPSCSPW